MDVVNLLEASKHVKRNAEYPVLTCLVNAYGVSNCVINGYCATSTKTRNENPWMSEIVQYSTVQYMPIESHYTQVTVITLVLL